MLIIAHRGNLRGPNPDRENSPEYLEEALEEGFQVEVDLWVNEKDEFWLGHDAPQYKVDWKFIRHIDEYAWFHCKNFLALTTLKNDLRYGTYFYHETDPYTLVSGSNMIWAYPSLTNGYDSNIIMALPEMVGIENRAHLKGPLGGVCTDYAERWSEMR